MRILCRKKPKISRKTIGKGEASAKPSARQQGKISVECQRIVFSGISKAPPCQMVGCATAWVLDRPGWVGNGLLAAMGVGKGVEHSLQ